jgi:hypothetical protein
LGWPYHLLSTGNGTNREEDQDRKFHGWVIAEPLYLGCATETEAKSWRERD